MPRLAFRPPVISAAMQAVPELIRAELADRWNMFLQMAARSHLRPPNHPDFLDVLFRVWAGSDFVAHNCIGHGGLLADLLESGDLLSDYGSGEMLAKVENITGKVSDIEALSQAVRELRRREMVRIAWRDLAGWATLEEILADLSDLADACVQVALLKLHGWQTKEFGKPCKADGKPQHLVVLAMGKLGARELNFSSDIDLIFAYPEDGQLRRRGGFSCEEFFTRLGQGLIHVLADTSEFGFVFRVDMRLRPYGDSGPLVMSFEAMEEYYQSQGRDWERYAMIKSRPITGDPADRLELTNLLRPFVYRRYLDYGAIEALRELKQQVVNEVQRKGQEENIKLGAGGIREVEFIVQSFQLVRGGREKALQERGLLRVLETLAQKKHLSESAAKRLADAYRFLRRVENHLQEMSDRQTHRLPDDEHPRLRLAYSMGYVDWSDFLLDLQSVRGIVQEQFDQIFIAPNAQSNESGKDSTEELSAVWLGLVSREEMVSILAARGFDEPVQVVALLEQLREGHTCRTLSSRGRARLDRLLPLILAATATSASPGISLTRIVGLLEAIAGRSAYLSLLAEHPPALSQLIKLFGTSAWIAELLTLHPLLLDDLIDTRTLYSRLNVQAFQRHLSKRLAELGKDDLEQQMESLRQEKQSAVLQTAVAEITGSITTLPACDQLSAIAESMLGHVIKLAWDYLVARHGTPRCGRGRKRRQAQFAVIAYGKLGGMELGYGSDLDLVFLHDSAGQKQQTDGPLVLDNAVFFIRLGQRIIHLINTQTPSGILYEIDMRLRPSGNSGLLVGDLESFRVYQQEEAWTWEHQALVRARAVAGGDAIREQFSKIRRDIIIKNRDSVALLVEVRDMRERMRQELNKSVAGYFDLKQGRGGVADIEFMVQYVVLRWAHEYPVLNEPRDNIGLLKEFASVGVMEAGQTEGLSEAYRQYLARLHQLALEGQPPLVAEHELKEYRQTVAGIWDQLMEC